MSELKPCPFCGGNRLEIDNDGVGHWVTCMSCATEGPIGEEGDKNDAIVKWNTRS